MTKIEALQKTIYNLENDVYEYSWQTSNTCNCGVLARTLLNGTLPSDAGYFNVAPSKEGNGVFSKRGYCITTGIEMPLVFKLLSDAGFTEEDLYNIEFLADKNIASKIGLKVYGDWRAAHGEFDVKKNVISYFKAWVEILKKEAPVAKTTQQYQDITNQLAVLPISETSDVKTMQLIGGNVSK